ncbi:MAG TPA: hypothetical protein VGH04_08670, partial [Gemmatimonadaceae bacterium]
MTSSVQRAPPRAQVPQAKNGARTNGAAADARLVALAYCDPDAALSALESGRSGLTDDEVRAR